MRALSYLPELLLLLMNAEQPLYTAFAFARQDADQVIDLSSFLDDVDRLIEAQIIELWLTEDNSRVQLPRVPEGALGLYGEELDDLDGTFDPLGLSITLGAKASPMHEQPWEASIDFVDDTFRLITEGDDVSQLLALIGEASGVRLVAVQRSRSKDGSSIVEGKVEREDPEP